MVDTWYENYEGEVITTSDFPQQAATVLRVGFPYRN
ncbi:hypothetical protein BH18THE2_BH18THE2_18450 [soil metagenome]